MKKNIAILAGDGIGPEVMDEAVKIIHRLEQKFGHQFNLTSGLVGGAAFDQYQNHLPAETIDLCEKSDAILFGSVGGPVNSQNDPKWRGVEKNCLLTLRKHFDLFANLRPAYVYPSLKKLSALKKEKIPKSGLDIMIIRELTGGIYFGTHETFIKDNVKEARDVMAYKDYEIARIVKIAITIAQKRKKRITFVDKANILNCSLLWREIINKMMADYPDITYEFMYVDNAAMQLVLHPEKFDLIVTENMFGDILSDLASTFAGSIGLSPSASLNGKGFGLYEPIGGSAPDIAGNGIANPIAQILSVAMMMRYSFSLLDESYAIIKAVRQTLENNIRTQDIFEKKCRLVSTKKMGEEIAARI